MEPGIEERLERVFDLLGKRLLEGGEEGGIIHPEDIYVHQLPMLCQLDHLLTSVVNEIDTRARIFSEFHHRGDPLLVEQEVIKMMHAARTIVMDIAPGILKEIERLKTNQQE